MHQNEEWISNGTTQISMVRKTRTGAPATVTDNEQIQDNAMLRTRHRLKCIKTLDKLRDKQNAIMRMLETNHTNIRSKNSQMFTNLSYGPSKQTDEEGDEEQSDKSRAQQQITLHPYENNHANVRRNNTNIRVNIDHGQEHQR